MKLFDLRKELKETFKAKEIDVEDVDFIISEVLCVPRTELILVDEIDEATTSKIVEKATMRLNNVPVDKIFKKSYFYGLELKVNNNVLSPRPESELLVEVALKYIKENNFATVLDMCTGSGCLAIAIKKNCDVQMTAVDVSSTALQIAKSNAKTHEVDINFVQSNMFEKLEGKFDLIVSNPPYIDSEDMNELDAEVIDNDPHIALDGGEYGLRYYNIIHDNLRKFLSENGIVVLEIGNDQKELVTSLFNDFELVEALKDYSGNDRVLVFKR